MRRTCTYTVSALTLALIATPGASPIAAARAANDPLYPKQANLRHLRVPQALAGLARRLVDVPVAITDTGIDLHHPDLVARLWRNRRPVPAPSPDGLPNPPVVPAGNPGWDLIGTDTPGALAPKADPQDTNGHGTAIAGIVGAALGNGIGMSGIAPNARLMALRTCWPDDQCYEYVNTPAFAWAADRGARVVNMSWDTEKPGADFVQAIRAHPRVLFVAVASNGDGNYDRGDQPLYPCKVSVDHPEIRNLICVTAIDARGALCGYRGHIVDLAAFTDRGVVTTVGGGYAPLGCFTSFAAPEVAGVAAILFGLYPRASGADVKRAILAGVHRTRGLAGKVASGGELDAKGAVDALQARFPHVRLVHR